MMILSINHVELMIYCTFELITLTYKCINDVYHHSTSLIERNIQCYKPTCSNCISIDHEYIVMLIIQVVCTIDVFAYLMNVYILNKRNHVFKANCTNLQSITKAVVTTFNVLLDIFIMLAILFINCIVSLQNNCKSHYKFICWCYCRLTHLQMALPSINQLELSILCTIEVIKSNVKDITNIYGQNESHNNQHIQSYNSISCTSVNYILLMIVEVICAIFVFYEMMHH